MQHTHRDERTAVWGDDAPGPRAGYSCSPAAGALSAAERIQTLALLPPTYLAGDTFLYAAVLLAFVSACARPDCRCAAPRRPLQNRIAE